MQDLTLSQEYLLCTLTEKGRLPVMNTAGPVCLTAGALLELQLAGCVAFGGKKVRVTAPLPVEEAHLHTLYDFLDRPKPLSLEKLVEEFHYTFTDSRLSALVEGIGGELVRAGAAVEEKGGLLGGKICYVPQRAAVDAVIEKLRAEILEDGEATEDAAALASLLGAAGTLKNYFSRYEQKQIKDKLRAITQAPAGKMVREMVEALENMIAVMTAVIAVT